MTTTKNIPARFLSATAALTGLALLTVGCGSSTPKATEAATTTTAATAAATDPNDSDYCQTARKWMVSEFDGGLDSVVGDPAAFKTYWTDYVDYIATATEQAPSEISADWPAGHDFLVQQVTPLLAKYNYDVERIKAEGSAAEKAIIARVEQGPNAEEQRAQDAVDEYEGRVCQTQQPPAADVSFAGATPNKAYCEGVQAGDEAVGEQVFAKQWSVDAVRTYVTSPAYAASYAKAKTVAPAEIKADVIADADWSTNQQVDVIEKYGYDARKLFLEGTAADRAIFQKSDPAIADHYARTVAYEEQVCGAE